MMSKEKVKTLYQSGAQFYDFTTILYRLIGLRMKTYRLRAIEKLSLQRGDHVLDLGCGTGLNFPYLLEKIGPEGHLIGIDLTPAMLDIARKRVERAGWSNVELVQSDITAYKFTENVNGILAAGLFGYIAEYDQVIKNAANSLLPGGHLVILDGKQPERLPSWIFSIVLALGRPFGFTAEYFEVRPWESVNRYLSNVQVEEKYGGMIYILSAVSA